MVEGMPSLYFLFYGYSIYGKPNQVIIPSSAKRLKS